MKQTNSTPSLREAAYASFITLAADNSLGKLDEGVAAEMIRDMTDDPAEQEAAIATFYGDKLIGELVEYRDASYAQMALLKTERRDAMFRNGNVDGDTAARVMFDEMSGDPSPMLKLKEQFFFG